MPEVGFELRPGEGTKITKCPLYLCAISPLYRDTEIQRYREIEKEPEKETDRQKNRKMRIEEKIAIHFL